MPASRLAFRVSTNSAVGRPSASTIQGGDHAWTGRIEVTHPDTDGIPTRVSTEGESIRVAAGEAATQANLLVRVGQANAEVKVALVSLKMATIARHRARSLPVLAPRATPCRAGYAATNRVLLEVWSSALGLEDLVRGDQRSEERLATKDARKWISIESLPTRWIGYESVGDSLFFARPIRQAVSALAITTRSARSAPAVGASAVDR